MAPSRQTTLAILLGAVAVVTAAILVDVLITVFFAITVAYVLVPLDRLLRRLGLPDFWASATATSVAFATVVVLFLPLAMVLYVRRRSLLALLDSLPDRVTIEFAEFVYTIDGSSVYAFIQQQLTEFAIGFARATPVLAAKAIVFGFVVFALLAGRSQVRTALLAPIPPRYHDIPLAIHRRVKGTLFALYVIQAATAVATFLIALPVFWLLGYPFPVTLAVAAGILQFLPVVGPSLVVIGLALFEVSAADVNGAITVLVVGLVLIGFLPDAVLRPRLARETARLPASVYFVGFTGGILSLGPVGIIAGPLIVAILSEVLSLLGAEMNRSADIDQS